MHYTAIQHNTTPDNPMGIDTVQYKRIQIQVHTIQYDAILTKHDKGNTMQYAYTVINHNTIQYTHIHCDAMQFNAILCNAIHDNTITRNALQYNTIHDNTI